MKKAVPIEPPIKRKSLVSKPKPKEDQGKELTKKFSMAIEEKISAITQDKDRNEEDFSMQNNDESKGADNGQRKASVLEKAKALIEKSKSFNQGNGNPRKYKSYVPKDDAFLTSIAVLSENKPIRKPSKEESEDTEQPELNENEMLRNLWLDDRGGKDDLAELRRMINKTKKNISDYASQLYTLKNNVGDVKQVYDDLGYRVKNNDLLYEMEKVYNEVMPKGDRNKLFTYEFYDDPEREEQRLKNKDKKPVEKKRKGVK